MYSASVSFTVPLFQIDEAHMWVGGDCSPSVLNWECVQVLRPNLVRQDVNVSVTFVFHNGNLAGMESLILVHHKHVLIPHFCHVWMSFHLLDPLCIWQICD